MRVPLFRSGNVPEGLEPVVGVGTAGLPDDDHLLAAVVQVHRLQLGDQPVGALASAEGTKKIKFHNFSWKKDIPS